MTTLKERALFNSLRIRSKPFIGYTRRKRIFDRNRLFNKSRCLIEKYPGLEKDLDEYYDDNGIVSPNLNESSIKLGDIIMAKQGLDLIKILSLYPEEREVMDRYRLDIDEIEQYRKEANNILLDGDEEIFRLLEIPIDNPFKCRDAYKKVLYYIAEKCIHGREIRVDFFREVVS